MAFTIYNEQGIPVFSTGNELEAQVIADMENGWFDNRKSFEKINKRNGEENENY